MTIDVPPEYEIDVSKFFKFPPIINGEIPTNATNLPYFVNQGISVDFLQWISKYELLRMMHGVPTLRSTAIMIPIVMACKPEEDTGSVFSMLGNELIWPLLESVLYEILSN